MAIMTKFIMELILGKHDCDREGFYYKANIFEQ